MNKKKKKEIHKNRILVIALIIIILGLVVFFQTRPKLQVVSVVSKIENYDYYIESNATKIERRYYKELEDELSDNKVDEDNYAKLVSKLFIVDYYSLNNKITNKDIGGVQFIHSGLRDKFINESSNTIYKYIENNLYGTRKQKLPEVSSVDIEKVENIKYKNSNFKDDNGYKVIAKVNYIKDYDYPKELKLTLIHEDNKLVIVEFE
jgi:hypothetical protein